MSAPLRIGQLAAAVGVKTDSVRFYERAGLLPKPSRSANGYRTYDDVTLKRLRFIKKAQSVGFTLDEIKRIFQLRAEGSPRARTSSQWPKRRWQKQKRSWRRCGLSQSRSESTSASGKTRSRRGEWPLIFVN